MYISAKYLKLIIDLVFFALKEIFYHVNGIISEMKIDY